MATLRETRDRIASVRSTLKITSAMKLVSSAKLRKAQKTIEALRPYEAELTDIYRSVVSTSSSPSSGTTPSGGYLPEDNSNTHTTANDNLPKTLVIAIASNSSLCGSFNTNVAKESLKLIDSLEDYSCLALGRKIRETLSKSITIEDSKDLDLIVGKPRYEASADLAIKLLERYDKGDLSRILLVYNSFVSMGKQIPVVRQLLPLAKVSAKQDDTYIFEPQASQIEAELRPRLVCLKLHAAILDSQAAEHAARTIAMQAASDNAEKLLSELTLEYNKARQQKITSEILDLAAGANL